MKMSRFIIRLLYVTACAFGLFTTVSAQIPSGYVQAEATVPALANGSFGAAWTNLSSSPQLGLLGCVSTFQTTVNGTIDTYGHFSILLADPSQICPSPSTWTFTFSCHQPPAGFITQITVTGAGSTDDITSQILAAAPSNLCQNSSGNLTIQTNGAPNASQTLLNFVDPSGFNGLSFTFSNPSGGIETFGVSGTLDNAGITNPQTTVNGQSCVLGGSCTVTTPPSTTFQHNSADLPDQSLLNFLDTPPTLPSGYQPVTFSNDSSGGLGGYVPLPSIANGSGIQMNIAPPSAGQWVYIFPTSVTTSTTGATYVQNVGNTSAQMGNVAYCSLGAGTATVTWTGFDVSLAALGISPSQVTAIYPFAYSVNEYGPGGGTVCGPISPVTYVPNLLSLGLNGTGTGATPVNFSPISPAISQYTTGALTGLSAANFSTLTITATATVGSSAVGPAMASVPLVGAWIEYTGTPVTQDSKINVVAPLTYDAQTNNLGIFTPLDIGTDVGAADAYAVNISWLSQSPLTTVKFLPAHLSTSTTPTFNLNGEGALTIVGPIGNALVGGDLNPNVPAVVIFGLNNEWYLQNPVVSGTGAGVSGGSNLATLVSTKISVGKVSPAAASSFIIGNPTLNTIDIASGAATYNTIVGGNANSTAAAIGETVGGGVSNTITGGDYGTIAGGHSNTSSGANATVVGGAGNNAAGTSAIAGGNANNASGDLSVALGDTNTSSGTQSTALGDHATASATNSRSIGSYSTASGQYSTVMGGFGSDYGNIGSFVFSGAGGTAAGPSSQGRAQREEHILYCTSSGSSATCRMTADGNAATTNNVAAIRNTSSALFTVDVLAADKTTGANLTWSFGTSLITRGASAATTAMSATNPAATAGPTTATPPAVGTPTVTADTTNGGYNCSITTPSGNTDTWYMLCVIHELVTQYN